MKTRKNWQIINVVRALASKMFNDKQSKYKNRYIPARLALFFFNVK